jgi:Rrf2 family iron-sulfur cluster assembly transcriptional regulator
LEENAMLISTKGRYALRVIIDLAEHQSERYVPLKEVAQRQEISEKYLESIIKLLVRAGLLTGLRGKGGGYQLTVAPDACTVGDILRLTEESLAPVSCLGQRAAVCPRVSECRTISMWQGLDRVIQEYLDHITIADMIKPDTQGGSDVI